MNGTEPRSMNLESLAMARGWVFVRIQVHVPGAMGRAEVEDRVLESAPPEESRRAVHQELSMVALMKLACLPLQ